MKKTVSFKLFFTVLWRGICQVFRFIGTLFGYKDESTYAKVVWRISATCLTALLALFTFCVLYAFVTDVIIPKWTDFRIQKYAWENTPISNRIVFQQNYWEEESRVYDKVAKKVLLKDVDWVVTSSDNDSLAVFSQVGRRGYLDRFTGEVRIPAVYSKAWVFSEGIAAVEKDGRLLFIDHAGKPVIDKDLEVHHEMSAYVFHDGYCLIKNPTDGKIGLINRKGDWALMPEYLNIRKVDSLWIVEKDNGEEAVLDNGMETILPFAKADYSVTDEAIFATLQDHTICRYNLKGELVDDSYITYVEPITYQTDKLYYGTMKKYDEEGNVESEVTDTEPYYTQAVARCRRYQADYGWYGLMSSGGVVITPPAYSSITAVGEDLYLCQDEEGHGILLNGKGKRIADRYKVVE